MGEPNPVGAQEQSTVRAQEPDKEPAPERDGVVRAMRCLRLNEDTGVTASSGLKDFSMLGYDLYENRLIIRSVTMDKLTVDPTVLLEDGVPPPTRKPPPSGASPLPRGTRPIGASRGSRCSTPSSR